MSNVAGNYNEQRKNLKSCKIEHSRFTAALRAVTNIAGDDHRSGEPTCLFISGPPGVGKTTLFNQAKLTFPADTLVVEMTTKEQFKIQRCVRPLISFEMPPRPTMRNVLNNILKDFCDPFWNNGTVDMLRERSASYLINCETNAILIDEASRLVDDTGELTSKHIIELLKYFHSHCKVSIIFIGLGRLRFLFEQDDQMADRFGSAFRMEAFQCFRETNGQLTQRNPEWIEWRGTLKAIQESTKIETEAPLHSMAWAERLYFATAGIFRRLKDLLIEALSLAKEEMPTKGISFDILERAFDVVLRRSDTQFNPFSADFPVNPPLPILEDDTLAKPRRSQRPRRLANSTGSSDLGAAIAQQLSR